MDSRTQICRCYESTVPPPQGQHFEACPFYADPVTPGEPQCYYPPPQPPDYTEALDRIAYALEDIAANLLLMRQGRKF